VPSCPGLSEHLIRVPENTTIVLGSMLALRRRSRYGLFFIDGNADFG
jgi:hypothetical protein